ncbi:TIGR02530 family flagellar biosynthesis protein [Eubacteriaceae bacterium ES3]|nr:TIGR02530 family flagellar biosynthesis protein [Eubacteriaceae bacterium ES3]
MADTINNAYFRMNDAIVRQTERLGSNQNKQATVGKQTEESSFKDLLNENLSSSTVTFTKHASIRSEQRNIEVNEMDLQKLSEACDQAQEKGINNALIMMKDSAFIVSAQNRRVITVMDKNDMKDKIVNDIDGALFI